jgi:putative oxidoreductase
MCKSNGCLLIDRESIKFFHRSDVLHVRSNTMSQSFFHRLLTTADSGGVLALRLPVGIIFAVHGAQKLFGWFGGYGLEGTGQFFGSIGLNPGYLMALLAGLAEFFGGLALIAGLLVRPAAAALAFAMLVAIFAAHWDKGFFAAAGGYEYALALGAAALSLLFTGAGRYSVDRALARQG